MAVAGKILSKTSPHRTLVSFFKSRKSKGKCWVFSLNTCVTNQNPKGGELEAGRMPKGLEKHVLGFAGPTGNLAQSLPQDVSVRGAW